MKQKRMILIVFTVLLASTLACSAIGDFVQGQVDNQLENAQATIDAGLEDFDTEGFQATVEAELGELDTEGLEATAAAMMEDIDAEELQAELGENVETEFPLPDSVNNLTEVMGTLIFQTDMTMEETLVFYRNAFTAEGYTERDLLTAITDQTASLVFDGHASGQAIVLQLVALTETSTNVALRFEDI
jgi:hypothetical protein